jgi:phosphonate transport system substrate-binding protein
MLRIITYLAPSIPAELFALVGRHIEETAGVPTAVEFETRISGPLDGDDDPFADGRADIGFVCAPSFRWLRARSAVELLPLPVPLDQRAAGRPVYFADVVVRSSSQAQRLDQLRGATWSYNDRNSKSGWFSMLERTGGEEFFGRLVHAGSHLRSLDLVLSGAADAAAIDSNTLRLEMQRNPSVRDGLRVIESWGPFPIQPVIIRSAVEAGMKEKVAQALLTMHERRGDELAGMGVERFARGEESAYLG